MDEPDLRTVGLCFLVIVAGIAMAGCMDDGGQEDGGVEDQGPTGNEGAADGGSSDGGDSDDAGTDAEGSGDSDTVPETELETPSSWPMVGFTAAHINSYGGAGDGEPEKAWTLGAPLKVAPSAGNGFVYLAGPGEDDARPTFHALVPETGDEAWRYHAEVVEGTAVDADHVYLADGTGPSDTPTAVDTETGEVGWTFEKAGFVSSTAPAILGDHVFFFDQGTEFRPDNATLYAFDTSTGEVDWKEQAPRADQLMTDGENLLVASGGQFFVLDADAGDQVSSLDTGARQTYQSVADNTLFTVQSQGIKAWDIESGEELWKHRVEHIVEGAPAIADGVVYLGGSAQDGPSAVYALDAQTGEEEWIFEADANWVTPSPAVAHGTVYVATQSGNGDTYNISAIDAEDGTEAWSMSVEFDRQNPSPPTSIVYVDGMLFADLGAQTVAVDG